VVAREQKSWWSWHKQWVEVVVEEGPYFPGLGAQMQ
jgi:hypothetical protein